MKIDVVKFSKDSLDFSASEIERGQVRTAIEMLPLELREVIFLREYGELTLNEIAGIWNRSEEAVLFVLGKARRSLRMLLAQTA